MNFYPHHIKDFNNSTRHLTRVERSVYRDAVELYYDSESVLTCDINRLERKLLCRSDEEKRALVVVLDEFFELNDDGYYHERCDIEIAKYRSNTSAKAKAGIASAKARRKKAAERQQNLTGVEQSAKSVEQTSNHEPVTSNHIKRVKKKNVPLDIGSVENLNIPAYELFCKYRKEVHGKPPYKSLALAKKLAKFSYDVQRQSVEYSIEKEWLDVFPKNIVKEKKREASRSLTGQALLDRCDEHGISTIGRSPDDLYDRLSKAEENKPVNH